MIACLVKTCALFVIFMHYPLNLMKITPLKIWCERVFLVALLCISWYSRLGCVRTHSNDLLCRSYTGTKLIVRTHSRLFLGWCLDFLLLLEALFTAVWWI